MLKEAGFKKIFYYQTIFKLPDKIDSVEMSQKGFGKGDFVVISGKRDENNY